MITLPKKQVTAPPREEPRPMPMMPPPAPAPVVPEVKVSVDNSYVTALIEKQQEQINALAARMDEGIMQLTEAVRRLEPGQGFSVTVTEWNNQGRIKTLKIVKE